MSRTGWSTSNFLRYSGVLVSAAPLTIAAWCKTPTINVSQRIAGIYNSASATTLNCFILGASNLGFITFTAADGVTGVSAQSTTSYPANTHFHACGVAASVTDRRVFLNGGGKGIQATSKVPGGMNRTSIGVEDRSAAAGPFDPAGFIAEVAMWRTALSDADVARHASGIDAIAIQREFLVGLWRLDGGGLTEVNVVNRNADMTVVGALSLSEPPPKVFMPRTPMQVVLPATY